MRRPLSDMFKPKEDADLKNEMNDMHMAFQVAGDRARKCLSTEDFREYKNAFLKAQLKAMDALLKYNTNFHKRDGGDMFKYAMTISTILTTLDNLRQLAGVINQDSLKGLRTNGKPEHADKS